MGLFSMFTVDAEHIRIQSQIDAKRITQTANNDAGRSIVESKKIVQAANNAASTSFANTQRRVQETNNGAAARMEAVAGRLQKTTNDVGAQQRGQRLRVQATYNEQAIAVNDAKKVLQAARNERAAGKTALANFGTSIANKEIMRQAGEAINGISEDLGRTIAGATSGRAFERLQNAELMGANVAALSVAGVGSSVTQSLNQALNLRQALKEEAENRELAQRSYAAGKAKGNVLREMSGKMGAYDSSTELDHEILIADQNVDAVTDDSNYSPILSNQDYTYIDDVQDFEVYSPQIDYTVYENHHKMGTFQKVATGIGAAVATYFGGPAAGEAVMDASMAMYSANNGNFAAAAGYGNQAIANATTGWKTFRAGGTDTKAGSSWGGDMLAKAGVNFKI